MTMNCKTVEDNLLNYVDARQAGELHKPLVDEIDIHIKQCKACSIKVLEETKIQSVLRELPVKSMSHSFRDRLVDSVRDKETPAKQNGFFMGFSAAMVASVMIWGVAAFIGSPSVTEPAMQPVVLALNEVKHVKLAFDAPADFNEVTLTIELPEHVELDGYQGESRISWQTSLNSGKNVLALPLIVKDAIKGEIVATVSNSDKTKVFRVPLATLIHGAMDLNTKITTS